MKKLLRATAIMLLASFGFTIATLKTDSTSITAFFNAKVEVNEETFFDAAKAGNVPFLQACINAEIDLNIQDNDGITALLYTLRNSHKDATLLLLNTKKIDLKPIDSYWKTTALTSAITYDSTEIVEALIKAGADINAFDPRNMNPLLFSTFRNNTAIAQLLITAGADVNAQDGIGFTALMYAFEERNLVIFKALLDAKADPTIKNKSGLSVIDYITTNVAWSNLEEDKTFLALIPGSYKLPDLDKLLNERLGWPKHFQVCSNRRN